MLRQNKLYTKIQTPSFLSEGIGSIGIAKLFNKVIKLLIQCAFSPLLFDVKSSYFIVNKTLRRIKRT